jgi:hypothetical protein
VLITSMIETDTGACEAADDIWAHRASVKKP